MLIGHVGENVLRTSAWSKCVIHYICENYSTHTQCGAGVSKGELDRDSILATKLGFPNRKVQF